MVAPEKFVYNSGMITKHDYKAVKPYHGKIVRYQNIPVEDYLEGKGLVKKVTKEGWKFDSGRFSSLGYYTSTDECNSQIAEFRMLKLTKIFIPIFCVVLTAILGLIIPVIREWVISLIH